MTIPTNWFYVVMLLLTILFIIQVYRVMEDPRNQIEWWQFISSRQVDGKYHADITKLGQAVGIFVASWIILKLSAQVVTITPLEFATILTLYLVFVAGVAGFQSYMRSKRGDAPASTPEQPEQQPNAPVAQEVPK